MLRISKLIMFCVWVTRKKRKVLAEFGDCKIVHFFNPTKSHMYQNFLFKISYLIKKKFNFKFSHEFNFTTSWPVHPFDQKPTFVIVTSPFVFMAIKAQLCFLLFCNLNLLSLRDFNFISSTLTLLFQTPIQWFAFFIDLREIFHFPATRTPKASFCYLCMFSLSPDIESFFCLLKVEHAVRLEDIFTTLLYFPHGLRIKTLILRFSGSSNQISEIFFPHDCSATNFASCCDKSLSRTDSNRISEEKVSRCGKLNWKSASKLITNDVHVGDGREREIIVGG